MYVETLAQAISVPANPTQPAAQTATFNSNPIDMSLFRRAMFLASVGAVSGTSPTLDIKLQESATSGGTYTDIAGGAATQITAANKTITLEVRAGQLSAGKQFVRVACTIGGTTPSFTMAVIPVGAEAMHKPGGVNDAAQVTQRLVV